METKIQEKKESSPQGPYGQLRQEAELEGAIFSYKVTPEDPSQGAVMAMVGGTNYEKSEFNRATQAMRQVGSTLNPLYIRSSNIETTDFTVASLVQDAPLRYDDLSYKTLEEKKVWKPGNYGNDYQGDITLRRALQLSRNVCTIRV